MLTLRLLNRSSFVVLFVVDTRLHLRLTNGPKMGAFLCALVAQLDRASGYEPEGREFESSQVRQLLRLFKLWRHSF